MKQLHAMRTETGDAPARMASGLFACCMIFAALAVGLSIHLHDGEYSPGAMGLITVAILATLAGVVSPGRVRAGIHFFEIRPLELAGFAMLVQLAVLFVAWPGVDLPKRGAGQLVPFDVGILLAAGAALAIVIDPLPRLRAFWFPLLVVVFGLLGVWMVYSSPHPHIDVWVFQQQGAAGLLKGRNPYTMTFPNIYYGGHQPVYGAGLEYKDRLLFGFPYPPVSLLLATLGYSIAGDHRYAQVFGLALAGLFIGYSRRGRLAMLAAALLLFTPRIFFVIGRGWTEPFVVMLLAATIFCACRRSRWLPVSLGLFLATKQYLVFAVPLTFFLLGPGWRWRDWFDLLWKSALVAAVVTMPFVLWDFHAFWKSTITVQEVAPFRWDALSYLVWYGFLGHRVTMHWVAVFWSSAAAFISLAVALWRAPRTPAGFAASLSLLSLGFFAFNKQAFCNYYFFVIGSICCAIAAGAPGRGEDEMTTTTPESEESRPDRTAGPSLGTV